jgi:hypothetical protein
MKAEILEKYPIPNNLKGRFLPRVLQSGVFLVILCAATFVLAPGYLTGPCDGPYEAWRARLGAMTGVAIPLTFMGVGFEMLWTSWWLFCLWM